MLKPPEPHGPLFMFIVRSYKIYENIRSNYKLLITLGPLLDGAEYLTTRLVFHQLQPRPNSTELRRIIDERRCALRAGKSFVKIFICHSFASDLSISNICL